MKLSIVSINYKTKEKTCEYIANIATVFAQELAKGDMELLIVDNGSQDGSAEYIVDFLHKNKFPHIELLPSTVNTGFAGGCNFGAQRAKGTYLLFLNNDTLVKDKGILHMVDFLTTHPEIGILGGKLQKEDGTAQLSAWKFYTLFNATLMLLGFERFGMLTSVSEKSVKVDWVTGGCMMIKKEVFEKIGRFDEKIFMYMEDMELCFRAKRNGYITYYFPDVEILHVGQGSSNRTFAIVSIYKGLIYFYKKYMPFWEQAVIRFVLFSKATILIILGKITGNTYLVSTYAQALNVLR